MTDTFHRIKHTPTVHDAVCDQVLHEYVPIIGINGIDAAVSQHRSNFSWVKWGHRIGELAAQHATKPHEALERASNNHFVSHMIHGAMWGAIVQRRSLDSLWEHFDTLASFIRRDARGHISTGNGVMGPSLAGHAIWVHACHGVGHALTWWAPNGPIGTPMLNAAQMVDYCMLRASTDVRSALDDTCVAACAQGIFHEAKQAHILSTIADGEPHLCSNLERQAFFCYYVTPARSFEHCYELSASRRNRASCIAALGMPGWLQIDRNNSQVKVATICSELHSRSVAFCLACGYGAAWWHGGVIGDAMMYHPDHSSVAIKCARTWSHDEFARGFCVQEANMVFSSAFLLDDLEFLTQLDYPADVLATQPAKVRFFFERAQTSWQLLNEEIRQPLPERQPQRQQSGQSSGAATFAALRTLYNGTLGFDGLLPYL